MLVSLLYQPQTEAKQTNKDQVNRLSSVFTAQRGIATVNRLMMTSVRPFVCLSARPSVSLILENGHTNNRAFLRQT